MKFSIPLTSWFIFVLSVAPGTSAPVQAAEPSGRNILLSVASEQVEHRTEAWTQDQCTVLHSTMAGLMRSSVTTACVGSGIDYAAFRKINEAKASKDFHYHIRLRELANGSVKLQVENWKTDRDETDFQSVGWTIDESTPELRQQLVSKMLNHVAVYDRNERKLKELLLVNGLIESEAVLLGSNGEYYSNFRKVSFEQAYERFKNEGVKQKNFLRTTLEIFATLGLGTVQYYFVTAEENAIDWDYNNWREYRQKVSSFKSWRFDTNESKVNIAHAFAGTLYAWAARTNGFNSLESLMFAIAGSTAWEYLCEAREKISINDQIVTPVGGFIIVEVLYQFGEFFTRGGNTLPNRILSTIFGGPQRFHAWIDKQKLPRADRLDQYGFNADVWHQFNLSTGYVQTGDSSGDSSGGISGGMDFQVVTLPSYDQEGAGAVFVKDTVMSQLTANIVYGRTGLQDVSALLKAVLAAYYRQDITRDEQDRLNGYSFMIGPTASVEYRSMGEIGGIINDWHASVNVIGAGIDVIAYAKDVRVQIKLDVFSNFTLVRSLAVEDYASVHGRDGIKSVMNAHEQNNYYYAFGLTAGSSLAVSYRGLELGGEVTYGSYDSIEGLDRFQEQVTRDVHLQDRYLSLKAWFAHPVYRKNIKMVYSVERVERTGEMAEMSRIAHVNRYMGRLVFLF